MKQMRKKTIICLVAAAAVLVGTVSIGSAMAYFTAYTQAEGGVVLDLGFTETTPVEKVVDGVKQVVIKNTGDFDCYVRMKALVGDSYAVTYTEPDGAGKWTPEADGFYYYSDIVKAKTGVTTQLDVNITFPVPENGVAPDFNVILVQECTPVLFDADGNPYADWSKTADVLKTIIKGEEGLE